MSPRGYLIKCPHPDCLWEQWAATQDAANRRYSKHARAKHPPRQSPVPVQREQLDLTGKDTP